MASYFLEVHEPMHLAAAAADSAMLIGTVSC